MRSRGVIDRTHLNLLVFPASCKVEWHEPASGRASSLVPTVDDTLEGSSATLELLDREVADPDRPLAGRVWSIDTFIMGGAASSSPGATQPALEFRTDGTLQVFTTCNTGYGSYTRLGQTLTLSSVSYSEAGCPDNRQNVEQSVQVVTSAGELTFEINANRLTLMRGSTGLGATTD